MPANSDDSFLDNPTPELTTWGVGPWQGELPTGPGSEIYDPELLQYGDTRNVVDKYRYWSMEAIVADLDSKRHNFHVAIENWQHDLNIGSIVRTANAGKQMPIIAIDNVPGCKQLETYKLPEACVLLFGQEGPGLSEAAIASAVDVVEISQYGSTRSINASAAAAITMHQWIMQHG